MLDSMKWLGIGTSMFAFNTCNACYRNNITEWNATNSLLYIEVSSLFFENMYTFMDLIVLIFKFWIMYTCMFREDSCPQIYISKKLLYFGIVIHEYECIIEYWWSPSIDNELVLFVYKAVLTVCDDFQVFYSSCGEQGSDYVR